jgi:hypothetical protein
MENDVLDEILGLLGLIAHDKQVGQAPVHLLEGPQNIQPPHGEWPSNGDCLELLGRGVNLPSEVLASSIRSYDMRSIASGRRPVKSLPKNLPDHAS